MRKRSLLYKLPQNLSLREQLGISQDHYASFCGISKSMLSMIEINQRSWPAGNENRIQLLMAFAEAEKEISDLAEFLVLDPRQADKLGNRILKQKIACYKVRSELEKMEFGYTQATRRLKTCKKLSGKFSNPQSIEFILIGLWEHTAKMKIKELNPMEQELLRRKLAWLEADLALLEKAKLHGTTDNP